MADYARLEAVLREIDERCCKAGLPPLSCTTTTDDGKPSPVFFESVEKYGLRLPDESDSEVLERILYQCYNTKYPDPENL